MSLDWEISDKAMEIIRNKSPFWEFRLCAQVLLDDCEQLKLSSPIRLSHGFGLDCVKIVDYTDWVTEKLDNIIQVMKQLDSIVSDKVREAFGQPGRSGIAHAVVEFAKEISDCYRRALLWSRLVEITPVDSRCIRVSRELVAFGKPILEAIEEFAYALFAEVDKALNAPEGKTPSINVTVKLKSPDLNRITEEMRQVVGNLKQDVDNNEEPA